MEDTEEFEFTVGLYHGSALRPFLFAVFIDFLTKEIQRKDEMFCLQTMLTWKERERE